MAWCRGGRQPPCHVYNKTQCGDCEGGVAFCKLGDLSTPRPTFWCVTRCSGSGACRPIDHGQGAAAFSEGAATTLKRKRGAERAVAAPPLHSNPWAAAAAASEARTAAITHLAPAGAAGAAAAAAAAVAPAAAAAAAAVAPAAAAAAAAVAPTAAAPTLSAAATSVPRLPRPLCAVHGSQQIRLCRVRKSGSDNIGRLFYSCRGGRSSPSCTTFAWADSAAGFPRCECAGAPLAGLRVSKQAHSGGRWFFGCRTTSDANQRRCQFFSWAPPELAERFGGLLTPLT